MEKYIGKSVYKGTAIGPVSVLKKKDSLVKRIHIDNTEEELKRLDAAKERTMTQLGQLYEKALQEVGEVNAAIFEVHQMMLEDDDYQDAIHSMIQNEEVNAEYAVAVTGDNLQRCSPTWMMNICRPALRMSGISPTGSSAICPGRSRLTGVPWSRRSLWQMI